MTNNGHHLGKIKIYKEVSKIYEKYKHACNDAKLWNKNKSNLETNFQKTENTFLQNKNADFIIDLNVNNMQNKKSLDKIRRINNLKHHKKR